MTVFGEFEPQNVVGHRVDPKKGTSLRHNACFETSRVKFHAQVASVGESGEKNKNKKERPYISRISPGWRIKRSHMLFVGKLQKLLKL